jgi:hypothetical protein
MDMTQRYNENSAAKHWVLYAARMAMTKRYKKKQCQRHWILLALRMNMKMDEVFWFRINI